MSASPKSKRTSPSNKFEDYILTYTVGESLYPAKTSSMTYLTGTAGSPYSLGSEIVDIGFVFNFDNKQYSRVLVSIYGFAILLDPDADPSQAFANTVANEDENSSVINSTWSDDHVLLSPWWDGEVRSIFRSTSDSGASTYITGLGLTVSDVNLGISPYPPGVDAQSGGIKKFYGYDAKEGRCFILRWKVFSNPNGSKNVVSYDIVLYESGALEFRYSPRFTGFYDLYENATIAIFANGSYANRYRDFSYLLRRDTRGKYRNGGAVYNGSYTDSDILTNTANYTISLSVEKDWPGLDKGACFRMTPPKVKRRQSRKVMNLRDSSEILRSGLFNDQKVVNFVNQKVQYPSMLPVDYVTSMNDPDSISIVELYSSGSIEVDMNLKSSLFDEVMFDSIAERGRK